MIPDSQPSFSCLSKSNISFGFVVGYSRGRLGVVDPANYACEMVAQKEEEPTSQSKQHASMRENIYCTCVTGLGGYKRPKP